MRIQHTLRIIQNLWLDDVGLATWHATEAPVCLKGQTVVGLGWCLRAMLSIRASANSSERWLELSGRWGRGATCVHPLSTGKIQQSNCSKPTNLTSWFHSPKSVRRKSCEWSAKSLQGLENEKNHLLSSWQPLRHKELMAIEKEQKEQEEVRQAESYRLADLEASLRSFWSGL